MKKIISLALALCILGALSLVGVSAADIDRNIVYYAAYGQATVDGKMDDIYLLSDEMYAENAKFVSSASVKEGQTATAKYRLVWNQNSLYIWCEVSDPTRSDPGAASASATKMDNVDIYILCDPEFSIEGSYSDRSIENSGQFRYNPSCTIDEEPTRKASWGGLTVINQLFGSYEYVGGYVGDNSGDYYFEMKIDFNEAYQNTLRANIATGADTRLGLGLQINDVMDNDAARDAYIFSNNATSGLSSDLKNCGVVLLNVQAGAEIIDDGTSAPVDTTPADTTTSAPTDTTPADTTTAETTPAVTTPVDTTTAEPSVTTTTAASDNSSGCGSSVAGATLAMLAAMTAAGALLARRRD